jgi:hypothetical protein
MRRKLGLASAVLFALTISATADETGTARPAGAGPNCFKITIQESDTKYAVDYTSTNTLAAFSYIALLVDYFYFAPFTVETDGIKCADNASYRITGIIPHSSNSVVPVPRPQLAQPPFQDIGTALLVRARMACFEIVVLESGYQYAIDYSTTGTGPAIGWISLFSDYGGQLMTLSTDGTLTDCGGDGNFYRLRGVRL